MFQLKDHAYSNVDGLDPSKGLLEAAMQKGLYKQTFCCYVTPDVPTPVRLDKGVTSERCGGDARFQILLFLQKMHLAHYFFRGEGPSRTR